MKTPYRFVSLNKKVVYPDWSKDVSFEKPLNNSLKGEIKVKIKALKPIFVRDTNNEKKFFNINGEYFIPGSSFKGMLRNIVEVISYSKMNLENKRLSYRDLRNPAYKKNAMDVNKIYHGWLINKEGKWVIQSLGKINNKKSLRIKYSELKQHIGEKKVEKIKEKKNAYEKYRVVDNTLIHIPSKGYLVFTGSTGNKSKEFIFTDKIEREYVLRDEVIQLFKEAYYIDNPSLVNIDWKNIWEKRFKRGEKIPVFFQVNNNGNIKHFGLSMLYKLPYRFALKDLLKKYQDYKENTPDFAETLFGYVNDKSALRGRVWTSHMKALNAKEFQEIELPLATPRATFYPFYLKQKKPNGTFYTYNDEDSILSGYKFYPHRRNLIINSEICRNNANVCTKFIPLKENTEFEGVIRFFNINEIELGALLSALTFFNKKGNYAHKLGMAKPYGFGSVKIEIEYTNKEYYIEKFINYMNEQLNEEYLNTKRIKEFLQIHTLNVFNDNDLTYMTIKEFIHEKQRGMIRGKKNNKNNYRKKR